MVSDPRWLATLLPSNSTPWERVLEGIDADLVSRDPVGLIRHARSVFECPLAWLPYLAAERSVNEYDGAWSEARQRAVVAGSFRFHQVQGTRPALDRALAPLGYRVRVVEWFERVQRRPYTFRLRLDLGVEPWTRGKRSEFIRVANGAKNAHTKLEAVEYSRVTGPAVMFVGGVVVRRRVLRIRQVPEQIALRFPAPVYVGAILTRRRTVRIRPRSTA